MFDRRCATLLLCAVVLAPVAGADAVVADEPLPDEVHFNRDIRPILSDTCLKCHGFDEKERKAGLRLDTKEGLTRKHKDVLPIVPGDPAASEVYRRIVTADEDELMPPASTGKKLTRRQKALVKRWIEQGMHWEPHWAFTPVQRPALPKVTDATWARNPVDAFVLSHLEKSGLSPSPDADKVTLIRRVTLDLTGLPPTPADVDAFVADTSADAYDKLVDRLLASPRYGERMALEWLDAARYADTNGFHIDNGRDMPKWREYVINAYNANKPFDEFTTEQLAGDLLPNASLEQRIASGFNRNHMINFEGGAIPEEYHTAYVLDRTNTTGSVWLGLTVACTQCHDHKYDPITQKDYYSLYAFFNNVPEKGLDGNAGNAAPMIRLPSEAQTLEMARLDRELTDASSEVAGPVASASPLGLTTSASRIATLRHTRDKIAASIPTAMVMEEMDKPRDTHILMRGAYDAKGERVSMDTPAFLPPMDPSWPKNRLGLAKWLVDERHPLTSRVAVNRLWQTFFGTGLVKTSEDFGSQGELPSHPELLDWLAAEFMNPSTRFARSGQAVRALSERSESKWDTKAFVKMLVTSSAYRQSSNITREAAERDPENRLLARGPRFRLHAEFIRDQALAVAGLLDPRIGGASVSPYQPAGLWEELMSREDGHKWTAQAYVQSHGADLYRRSMYTFWKRTVPPPQLATFDAPDRETCTVKRARTNTPLQALVLMNDPTYVEASRKLAERVLREGGSTPAQRIALAFRLPLARKPRAEEVAVLKKVLEEQLAHFRSNSDAAAKLLGVGESPRDEKFEAAELAAWTTVASVILNLDETVTKG